MRYSKPVVFFDASVIIAGLLNPLGGSGKIIRWVKEKKIIGLISVIIVEEVKRHIVKTDIESYFIVANPPSKRNVRKYNNIVIDQGDSHVLASALELGVDYLVSLDRKHILVLKDKIKKFLIVSPKELIERI